MTHEKHPKPTRGDRLYETFVCGGVGGAAVVLFFLAVDVTANRPLFTPSLVGSVLFLGADAASVEGVSLGAVSAATVGHIDRHGRPRPSRAIRLDRRSSDGGEVGR